MEPANETKDALRRVAEELLSLANQGPVNQSPVTNTTPTNSATSVSRSAQSSNNARLHENMRVFNYAKGRSSYVGKGKGPAKKKTPTCSLKFFCLGSPSDDKPPASIGARTALCNAGLGPANITLEMNGLPVHQKLLERFPPLSSAGGYELLLYQRSGVDQGFHQIPKPLTPSRLKELACQATVYIRPLQVDISETNMTDIDSAHEKEQPAPKVECLICQKEIEMDKLRSHQEEEHPTCRKRKHQVTLNVDLLSDDNDDIENQSNDEQDSPSTSSHPSKTDEIQHLAEMFPLKTERDLQACLQLEGSYSKAVVSLLRKNSLDACDNVDNNEDIELMTSAFEQQGLQWKLKSLQKNFSKEEKVKLKVDEEDLFQDAMSYYKDNGFDPKKRLRIIYKGQAAADTGGVIRQFYTQLLNAISNTFFQGLTYRSPIYNSEMVATGIMKLVGIIIVHSILQGGPGFPVFSLAVYRYIATGDLQEAVKTMTISDCSMRMKDLILKIAQVIDVADLDQEEIISALSDCGLTTALTNDNKVRVIQSLIVHDTIGKPKIVLDQLREGQKTLGLGSRMKQNPEVFQELFVAGNKEIKGDEVKKILLFPTEMSDAERNTMLYLNDFIASTTPEALKAFLTFATGAPCLPEFGFGTIKIEFSDVSSIFSSTCLNKLTFPQTFPDKDTFIAAVEAVSNNAGKAFTSV